MHDSLGALWVSCPSRGAVRGMGTSQKFLVVSLARTDFRKLKEESLACAFFD